MILVHRFIKIFQIDEKVSFYEFNNVFFKKLLILFRKFFGLGFVVFSINLS